MTQIAKKRKRLLLLKEEAKIRRRECFQKYKAAVSLAKKAGILKYTK